MYIYKKEYNVYIYIYTELYMSYSIKSSWFSEKMRHLFQVIRRPCPTRHLPPPVWPPLWAYDLGPIEAPPVAPRFLGGTKGNQRNLLIFHLFFGKSKVKIPYDLWIMKHPSFVDLIWSDTRIWANPSTPEPTHRTLRWSCQCALASHRGHLGLARGAVEINKIRSSS